MPGRLRRLPKFCRCCKRSRHLFTNEHGVALCEACDYPRPEMVLGNTTFFRGPRTVGDDLDLELSPDALHPNPEDL